MIPIFDVIVAGELNIDLILDDLRQMPAKGREVIANRMTLSLGSSAAIFANNLRTIGAKVRFTGKLGKDLYGNFILETLAASGVDTALIHQSADLQTGATIAFNDAQERAMITFPGAMQTLRETDITDEMLATARHLHVSSAFLQPGLKPGLTTLFKRAKTAGMTTSFDPQWDPEENWDLPLHELLNHVDVFLPNIAEILAFTKTQNLDDALTSLQHLPAIIAVKNGSEGAILAQGQERIRQKAFTNGQIVDCIGAGDSFNAGFIHHYLQHQPLGDCLQFANLMGAINTLGAGGTGAFQSLEYVKNLAHKHFNYAI